MTKNNSGKKGKPKTVFMKATPMMAGHMMTGDPKVDAAKHRAMKAKKKK